MVNATVWVGGLAERTTKKVTGTDIGFLIFGIFVVRAAVIPATAGSALWFVIKYNVLVACVVVAITVS